MARLHCLEALYRGRGRCERRIADCNVTSDCPKMPIQSRHDAQVIFAVGAIALGVVVFIAVVFWRNNPVETKRAADQLFGERPWRDKPRDAEDKQP